MVRTLRLSITDHTSKLEQKKVENAGPAEKASAVAPHAVAVQVAADAGRSHWQAAAVYSRQAWA